MPLKEGENNKVKVDYRVWNAFRSKLAACILNGIENIYIKPGAKVLYLGAANGTTVSHVSDIVGEVIPFINLMPLLIKHLKNLRLNYKIIQIQFSKNV